MYGYEGLTQLPEFPVRGTNVLQNFHNSRVLWHGRSELPEVPGAGVDVTVPVPRLYVGPA